MPSGRPAPGHSAEPELAAQQGGQSGEAPLSQAQNSLKAALQRQERAAVLGCSEPGASGDFTERVILSTDPNMSWGLCCKVREEHSRGIEGTTINMFQIIVWGREKGSGVFYLLSKIYMQPRTQMLRSSLMIFDTHTHTPRANTSSQTWQVASRLASP